MDSSFERRLRYLSGSSDCSGRASDNFREPSTWRGTMIVTFGIPHCIRDFTDIYEKKTSGLLLSSLTNLFFKDAKWWWLGIPCQWRSEDSEVRRWQIDVCPRSGERNERPKHVPWGDLYPCFLLQYQWLGKNIKRKSGRHYGRWKRLVLLVDWDKGVPLTKHFSFCFGIVLQKKCPNDLSFE